jgi:hypothetical protein
MSVPPLLLRMGAGWSLVLSVLVAESADPAHGGHALLKCREPTIRAAAAAGAVIRTPRIILGLGLRDYPGCRERDCQYK